MTVTDRVHNLILGHDRAVIELIAVRSRQNAGVVSRWPVKRLLILGQELEGRLVDFRVMQGDLLAHVRQRDTRLVQHTQRLFKRVLLEIASLRFRFMLYLYRTFVREVHLLYFN